MKQRVYIDTSVIGGYYDPEFADFTIPLFDRIKNGEFTLLYSSVTQDELENAPANVKALVQHLSTDYTEFLETSDDAVTLANEYIAEKVVGQTSYTDCLHIALATIYRADYLISWNFKHIVNVQRIRGYNAINIKNGYKQLEIRSPRDFIKYENNE
ncbi:MAG: PIN domain-containing protein [Prevotellaceae bacterium]|jgi:predicted nucleic acid-binding protein|nr:PIN domain-containing protein [Prevotellaceae bacterium]